MESSVLWSGTLWSKSIEERLEAAAAGGFAEISLFPTDVTQFDDSRSSVGEIPTLADEYDVDVTILEPYTRWVPEWEPPSAGAVPPYIEFDEDEFFRIGEALDIESLTVMEPFGKELDVEKAATHFGNVCDKAAERGWRVHLEFIPFTGIPDLETAWEIVERADRNNGGLLFDTLHFYRSIPDFELLQSIPGEDIYRVQVSDAAAEPQGSLREDALHHRKLPGDGELDLVRVMETLEDIGGLRSVGIETISDELDELPAVEAGRQSGRELRDLLESAGASVA